MKLILAVSRDGFLASGPDDDDMRWTGPADKYAFRLLTLSDGEPLLAGKQTARLMPPLPGRDVVHLSRSTLPLDMAGRLMREAWLIGGPTVALEALRLGLVHRAFIHRTQHVLGEGIPFAPLRELLPKEPWGFVKNDALVIELYREDQPWPAR